RVRQVAERGMARDDLVPAAMSQARSVAGVERIELEDQRPRSPRMSEHAGYPRRDRRQSRRGEPDMWVDRPPPPAVCRAERLAFQKIDRAGLTLRRILESRLEPAAEIEHDVGALDVADVSRRQFDVVWLLTGRCEVFDVRRAERHLLGHPRERVEAGNDRRPRARTGGASACSCREHRNEDRDETDEAHASTLARL